MLNIWAYAKVRRKMASDCHNDLLTMPFNKSKRGYIEFACNNCNEIAMMKWNVNSVLTSETYRIDPNVSCKFKE